MSCPSPTSIQGSVCSSLKSRLLLSFVLEKAPFLVVSFFAPSDTYTSHITPLAQFLALGDISEGHGVPKAPGGVAGGNGWRLLLGLEKGEPPGHRCAAWMGPAHPEHSPWLPSSPQVILDAALLHNHAHSNELSPSPCTPGTAHAMGRSCPTGLQHPTLSHNEIQIFRPNILRSRKM